MNQFNQAHLPKKFSYLKLRAASKKKADDNSDVPLALAYQTKLALHDYILSRLCHFGIYETRRKQNKAVIKEMQQCNNYHDLVNWLDKYAGDREWEAISSQIDLTSTQGLSDLKHDCQHLQYRILEGKKDQLLITGDIIYLSFILIIVKEQLNIESYYEEGNQCEVVIEARQRLVIDADICLPGVSLLLRSNFAVVIGERAIDLSGKDGQDGDHGINSESSAPKKRDGTPGKAGQPGSHGGNLVCQFMKTKNISKLKIDTTGGNGGNGGNGGHGCKGDNQENGKPGDPEAVKKMKGCILHFTHAGSLVSPGEKPPPTNTRGGHGGNGGAAGKAGTPGRVIIQIVGKYTFDTKHYDLSNPNIFYWPTVAQQGKKIGDGRGGLGGKGRKGGKKGRKGIDYGWEWPAGVFTDAERYKNRIAGELDYDESADSRITLEYLPGLSRLVGEYAHYSVKPLKPVRSEKQFKADAKIVEHDESGVDGQDFNALINVDEMPAAISSICDLISQLIQDIEGDNKRTALHFLGKRRATKQTSDCVIESELARLDALDQYEKIKTYQHVAPDYRHEETAAVEYEAAQWHHDGKNKIDYYLAVESSHCQYNSDYFSLSGQSDSKDVVIGELVNEDEQSILNVLGEKYQNIVNLLAVKSSVMQQMSNDTIQQNESALRDTFEEYHKKLQQVWRCKLRIAEVAKQQLESRLEQCFERLRIAVLRASKGRQFAQSQLVEARCRYYIEKSMLATKTPEEATALLNSIEKTLSKKNSTVVSLQKALCWQLNQSRLLAVAQQHRVKPGLAQENTSTILARLMKQYYLNAMRAALSANQNEEVELLAQQLLNIVNACVFNVQIPIDETHEIIDCFSLPENDPLHDVLVPIRRAVRKSLVDCDDKNILTTTSQFLELKTQLEAGKAAHAQAVAKAMQSRLTLIQENSFELMCLHDCFDENAQGTLSCFSAAGVQGFLDAAVKNSLQQTVKPRDLVSQYFSVAVLERARHQLLIQMRFISNPTNNILLSEEKCFQFYQRLSAAWQKRRLAETDDIALKLVLSRIYAHAEQVMGLIAAGQRKQSLALHFQFIHHVEQQVNDIALKLITGDHLIDRCMPTILHCFANFEKQIIAISALNRASRHAAPAQGKKENFPQITDLLLQYLQQLIDDIAITPTQFVCRINTAVAAAQNCRFTSDSYCVRIMTALDVLIQSQPVELNNDAALAMKNLLAIVSSKTINYYDQHDSVTLDHVVPQYSEVERALLMQLRYVLTPQQLLTICKRAVTMPLLQNRVFSLYCQAMLAEKNESWLAVQQNRPASTLIEAMPYRVLTVKEGQQFCILIKPLMAAEHIQYIASLSDVVVDTELLARAFRLFETYPPSEWAVCIRQFSFEQECLRALAKRCNIKKLIRLCHPEDQLTFTQLLQTDACDTEQLFDILHRGHWQSDSKNNAIKPELLLAFKQAYERYCQLLASRDHEKTALHLLLLLNRAAEPISLTHLTDFLNTFANLTDVTVAYDILLDNPQQQWLAIVRNLELKQALVALIEQKKILTNEVDLLNSLMQKIMLDPNMAALITKNCRQFLSNKTKNRFLIADFLMLLEKLVEINLTRCQFNELSKISTSYWSIYIRTIHIDNAFTTFNGYEEVSRIKWLLIWRDCYENHAQADVDQFASLLHKRSGEPNFTHTYLEIMEALEQKLIVINPSLLKHLMHLPQTENLHGWLKDAIDNHKQSANSPFTIANSAFTIDELLSRLETNGFALSDDECSQLETRIQRQIALSCPDVNILESLVKIDQVDTLADAGELMLPTTISLPPIMEWEAKDFSHWRKLVADKNADWRATHQDHILSMIHFAVMHVFPEIEPRDSQWLSCLLFINADDEKRGRLGEIKTGNGKSLLTAMLALYQCLANPNRKTIDVLSSSLDCAVRDSKRFEPLFSLFGLTCMNNCDDEARRSATVREKRYRAHVVYGDISSFQRDKLLTERRGMSLLRERDTDLRIIDEVDSVFLDNAQKVLYLSHDIKSLQYLRSVYVQIHNCVNAANADSLSLSALIKRCRQHIEDQRQQQLVDWPVELDNFVEYRIAVWVENARKAKTLFEDDAYVLTQQFSDFDEKIYIVDKTTGYEQEHAHWSGGLHQFLQLKHKKGLTPESLKAVFISNYAFLKDKNFKGKTYAMSGTLGSSVDQAMLCDLYDVDLFKMPSFVEKQFTLHKPTVIPLEKDKSMQQMQWLGAIYQKYKSTSNRGGCSLIICGNVQDAKIVEEYFYQQLKIENNSQSEITALLHCYSSRYNTCDVGHSQKPLQKGQVIIATNLASRGTDIIIDEDLTNPGGPGLHVIATYLPHSRRIDEQIFGRTARNGLPGSGEFIIKSRENKPFYLLQKARDEAEQRANEYVKYYRIPAIEFEQTLSERFADFIENALKPVIQNDFVNMISKKKRFSSDYLAIQVKAIEDAWAFWLDEHREQLTTHAVAHEKLLSDDFADFCDLLLAKAKKPNLMKCVETLHETVALAECYARYDKLALAEHCFERAEAIAPSYGAIASYRALLKVFGEKKFQKREQRKAFKKTLRRCEGVFAKRSAQTARDKKLLQLTAQFDEKNNIPGSNVFTAQCDQEKAIYQAHRQAIGAIVGVPILPSMLKEKNIALNSAQSEAVIDFLIENAVLTTARVHRQYRDNYDCLPELAYAKEAVLAKLEACFKDTKKPRVISVSDFFEVLLDAGGLRDKLVEHGILTACVVEKPLDKASLSPEETIKPDRWQLSVDYSVYEQSEILQLPKALEKYRANIEKIFRQHHRKVSRDDDTRKLNLIVETVDDLLMPGSQADAAQILWNMLLSQSVVKAPKVRVDYSLTKKAASAQAAFFEDSEKKLRQFIKGNELFKDHKNITTLSQDVIDLLKHSTGKLKTIQTPIVCPKQLISLLPKVTYEPSLLLAKQRYLGDIITLEAPKPWLIPGVGGVLILAVVELAAGVSLVVFTKGIGAKAGIALLRASYNDVMYAIQAQANGHFDFNAFMIYKGINTGVALLMLGFEGLDLFKEGKALFSFQTDVKDQLHDVLQLVYDQVTTYVGIKAEVTVFRGIIEYILSHLEAEINRQFSSFVDNQIFATEAVDTQRVVLKDAVEQIYLNSDNEAEIKSKLTELFNRTVLLHSQRESSGTIVAFSVLNVTPAIIDKLIQECSNEVATQLSEATKLIGFASTTLRSCLDVNRSQQSVVDVYTHFTEVCAAISAEIHLENKAAAADTDMKKTLSDKQQENIDKLVSGWHESLKQHTHDHLNRQFVHNLTAQVSKMASQAVTHYAERCMHQFSAEIHEHFHHEMTATTVDHTAAQQHSAEDDQNDSYVSVGASDADSAVVDDDIELEEVGGLDPQVVSEQVSRGCFKLFKSHGSDNKKTVLLDKYRLEHYMRHGKQVIDLHQQDQVHQHDAAHQHDAHTDIHPADDHHFADYLSELLNVFSDPLFEMTASVGLKTVDDIVSNESFKSIKIELAPQITALKEKFILEQSIARTTKAKKRLLQRHQQELKQCVKAKLLQMYHEAYVQTTERLRVTIATGKISIIESCANFSQDVGYKKHIRQLLRQQCRPQTEKPIDMKCVTVDIERLVDLCSKYLLSRNITFSEKKTVTVRRQASEILYQAEKMHMILDKTARAQLQLSAQDVKIDRALLSALGIDSVLDEEELNEAWQPVTSTLKANHGHNKKFDCALFSKTDRLAKDTQSIRFADLVVNRLRYQACEYVVASQSKVINDELEGMREMNKANDKLQGIETDIAEMKASTIQEKIDLLQRLAIAARAREEREQRRAKVRQHLLFTKVNDALSQTECDGEMIDVDLLTAVQHESAVLELAAVQLGLEKQYQQAQQRGDVQSSLPSLYHSRARAI